MAVLSSDPLTVAGRFPKLDLLVFTKVNVAGNTAEAIIKFWTIAAGDFSEGILISAQVESNSAATHNALVTTDRGSLSLQKSNDTLFQSALSTHQGNIFDGAVTTPNRWIINWNMPFPGYIFPGDMLTFRCPPGDDSGSPAVDFTFTATVKVTSY